MLKLSNLTGFGGSGATGVAPSDTGMFVWGDNSSGQAGGGGGTADPVQVPTQTDTADDIVIPSKSFSMASHMAYIIAGELYTTGLNQYGQLGFGDLTNKNTFTKVVTNGDATDYALGVNNSYTVRDGKVNGCGRNNASQLTSSQSSNGIKTFAILFEPSATDNSDASKVYASRDSGAVITAANGLWVWGKNITSASGFTLDSPFDMSTIFDEFLPPGDRSLVFSDVGLGDNHIIALSIFNDTYTDAKSNSYGQQGNGSETTDGPSVVNISGITKVAAGRYTSYVIADGVLYAAGRGDNGEMGAATTSQVNASFIDIGGGITDWIDVQAGDEFVIAQRQDGTIYHSGNNGFYQQGNNVISSDQFGFVQVIGVTTAKVYNTYTVARRTIYGIVDD